MIHQKQAGQKAMGIKGPTLIISPLVALMDDQREKWDVELNERLENAGLSTIKSRFLTTGDLTRDPEKMELLRNNEIDVLCCSPEDLMDPKKEEPLVRNFRKNEDSFQYDGCG